MAKTSKQEDAKSPKKDGQKRPHEPMTEAERKRWEEYKKEQGR